MPDTGPGDTRRHDATAPRCLAARRTASDITHRRRSPAVEASGNGSRASDASCREPGPRDRRRVAGRACQAPRPRCSSRASGDGRAAVTGAGRTPGSRRTGAGGRRQRCMLARSGPLHRCRNARCTAQFSLRQRHEGECSEGPLPGAPQFSPRSARDVIRPRPARVRIGAITAYGRPRRPAASDAGPRSRHVGRTVRIRPWCRRRRGRPAPHVSPEVAGATTATRPFIEH